MRNDKPLQNDLLRAVFCLEQLKSASLAMHINIIRELQNNLFNYTKYKIVNSFVA